MGVIYDLINAVLAALQYTMMGRLILSLFVKNDDANYISRFFARLTDPVLKCLSPLIPLIVTARLRLIFGFIYIFLARVILTLVFRGQGWSDNEIPLP